MTTTVGDDEQLPANDARSKTFEELDQLKECLEGPDNEQIFPIETLAFGIQQQHERIAI